MITPIFHIGFPKSGSTFLQRQVFPFLNKYKYHSISTAKEDSNLYELLNDFHINLFKTDGMNFNLEKAIEDKNKILNLNKEKASMFSYEYAIGVLFGYPDAVVKSERLFQVFGKDLKIIMIIREQKAILSSQYRDHPFEPYNIHKGKPISFEKWYKQTKELRFFRFTDLVHYNKLINTYDTLFGKDNVLVLPLELVSHNPELYAQKMADFLNINKNIILENLNKPSLNMGNSSGENTLRKLRRTIPISIEFSKILPKPLHNLAKEIITRGETEKIKISENLKNEINQDYMDSNKALEKRIDISLSQLGYAVSKEQT